MISNDPPQTSLRERKKRHVRTALQAHALRLFAEQGYAKTTVEQIAAAAEVSPSTFFRYFPTKEAVVLYDNQASAILAAFQTQSSTTGVITALRLGIQSVFEDLPKEIVRAEERRFELINRTPELREAMLRGLVKDIPKISSWLAERSGRRLDERRARVLAGAIVGVGIVSFLDTSRNSMAQYVQEFVANLENLEVNY